MRSASHWPGLRFSYGVGDPGPCGGRCVGYSRRPRQADPGVDLVPRRSKVTWQAGRWDADTRHAYVANMGSDTAYEVSVTTCDGCDRVIRTVEEVPAFGIDQFSSSQLPCYVVFSVPLDRQVSAAQLGHAIGRAGRSVDVIEDTRRLPGAAHIAARQHVVAVRIDWRSAQGQWSSQTVCTE